MAAAPASAAVAAAAAVGGVSSRWGGGLPGCVNCGAVRCSLTLLCSSLTLVHSSM